MSTNPVILAALVHGGGGGGGAAPRRGGSGGAAPKSVRPRPGLRAGPRAAIPDGLPPDAMEIPLPEQKPPSSPKAASAAAGTPASPNTTLALELDAGRTEVTGASRDLVSERLQRARSSKRASEAGNNGAEGAASWQRRGSAPALLLPGKLEAMCSLAKEAGEERTELPGNEHRARASSHDGSRIPGAPKTGGIRPSHGQFVSSGQSIEAKLSESCGTASKEQCELGDGAVERHSMRQEQEKQDLAT